MSLEPILIKRPIGTRAVLMSKYFLEWERREIRYCC